MGEHRGPGGNGFESHVVRAKNPVAGLALATPLGQADTSLNVRRPLAEFQACCTRVLALWLWAGREGDRGGLGAKTHRLPCEGFLCARSCQVPSLD